MPWPLQNDNFKIEQKFGVVHNEQFNLTLPHKGVKLSTLHAEPVHSVFDGSVAFAGALDGYGPTVILDHGDHYYTVYAGNAQLQVKKGDEVKQNQVIAETGSDGLYFEVRHFSEPHDPKAWLKGIPL